MIVEDCVERMIRFKERVPTIAFDLSPSEFRATIPGIDPFWALSLCRLMDKLETWEAEQATAR